MKRVLIVLLASALALGADAAVKARPRKTVVSAVSSALDPYRRTPYVGAISLNAKTGKVLFSDGADSPARPASVTKLMTALLVLEDVKAGRYALADDVVATDAVYKSEPSWVGIKVGEKMSVGDMLTALMVESANDVAIALAVKSAGSIQEFVAKMNARARALGMTGTTYYNPNGLPPSAKYPWKGFNVTTARDQSRLALELVRNHPEILRYTSVKTCDLISRPGGFRTAVTRSVNGGEPKTTALAPGEKLEKVLRNHNNVMVKDKLKLINSDGREAVDGLKTGYIDAGGSSVVLTGTRGGERAIVVVLGSASAAARDESASRLMTDALGSLAW